MEKTPITQFDTFTDVCAARGKNEGDYDVAKGTTNKEKAAICLDRVKLIAAAYNDDQKVNMADTSQWKYYPWFRIIPDSEAPAGFRLSFVVYDCDDVGSSLGARPYFLDSDHAEDAGEHFLAEFEQWAQYEALSLNDEN